MSTPHSPQRVAEPFVRPDYLQPEGTDFVAALTDTLKGLDGCCTDADIQNLSSKIESVVANSRGEGDVLCSIRRAELALLKDGQTVKAKRMAKVGTLIGKLSYQKTKQQRKTLRKILKLCAKNVGVTLGKRSCCVCCGSHSLCCNIAIITGSVLVIAGAVITIALASAGAFVERPEETFVSHSPPDNDLTFPLIVEEEFGQAVQTVDGGSWSVTVNDDVDQESFEHVWKELERMVEGKRKHLDEPGFASDMHKAGRSILNIPDQFYYGPGGAESLLMAPFRQ